jgi:L-threonylcarbamoyladenylate synthase
MSSPPVRPLVLPASDPAALEKAAALLRAGDLVAFPTDTVYGVGAIFSNAAAVKSIYLAKGRPDSKGIPLLLASLADLPFVAAEVSDRASRLAAAFWPGPLTLVLPKSPAVPPAVSQTSTVAVRVPDHPLARALITAVGAPLAVTSANRSGEPATVAPTVVRQTLGDRIAAILDGGLAPGGIPSTILDCTVDPPHILRPGPIPAGTILECCRDYRD